MQIRRISAVAVAAAVSVGAVPSTGHAEPAAKRAAPRPVAPSRVQAVEAKIILRYLKRSSLQKSEFTRIQSLVQSINSKAAVVNGAKKAAERKAAHESFHQDLQSLRKELTSVRARLKKSLAGAPERRAGAIRGTLHKVSRLEALIDSTQVVRARLKLASSTQLRSALAKALGDAFRAKGKPLTVHELVAMVHDMLTGSAVGAERAEDDEKTTRAIEN